ncbi:tripartite tricarboxylate transporter substrate binding protein [Acidovorax carolinensis]|uniref:tripartite tricarboxylate transporter substrate binding protein n=1 Tax=Acidovorax carolinensis TaxID=553814 RepID=UPI000B349388|nr:tripartite tricarboxylate transporter substrate binding protein [Acidovorax carolinensis]ART49516.1 ABC transporter substrate-binding protein [Acidovorax carolinensis]
MPSSSSRLARRTAALIGGLLLSAGALAQNFPAKPVTLIVPYPAGGVSDVIARTVNNTLGKQLGQPVIVENLGGASGSIAAQKMLSQPSDGHVVFQGSPNELILAPLAMSAVKFKSEDFRLVNMIATAQIGFLTRGDLPANSIDEFVEYARKQAQQGRPITYASVGPGSFYHLLGEHLSKVTGIPMVHVPYKGGAPAEQDLISGQVDIFLSPFATKHVDLRKAGRIKVLALLNSARLDTAKDIPAITESKALKDFTFNIWTGYFVKRDTPEAVVATLHKAIAGTLTEPTVRANLEAASQTPAPTLSVAEAAKAYTDGTAQFRAIAKSINLQAQ